MDYIEGLFLGKLWSDTDFENRRHVSLFVLYGLFVDLLAFFTYWTGKSLGFFCGRETYKIVILCLLFVASPFINFRYYRMPLWGKLLVLLEKLFKHVLILSITLSLLLSRLSIAASDLQEFFISYLNSTLEKYTEKFYESAGTFATVLGVISGGLHIVVVFALWTVVAIVVPGVIYLLLRVFQYGYDWVIAKLIIRKVFVSKKK